VSPTLEIALEKLQIRSPIGDADRAAFLALPFRVRTLEPSSYIIREGDAPTQCAVLLSGFAYRQKLAADGGRQIIGVHIPGDILDLQNLYLSVSDHGVQTLTRATVALISRADLQTLARTSLAIQQAFFVDALVDSSIFREWILNVGRRDARERVAHLLCEIARRLEAAGLTAEYGYELPMTQEQLADATGLTPVHISRTLRALEAEKLISRSKRHIRFPDWDGLRKAADFNERYLHLDQLRPHL